MTGTSRGEMNFQAGAKLTVDGGYFCNQNRRSGSAGHHIGVDAPGTAEVRVVNGGEFHSKHLFVRVGMNSKATGILSADGGTVNIADGKADLRVATGDSEGNQTATGIVALTNGTLKAAAIWLAENTDGNTAKLNFKDSHLYINKIYESKQLTADSFVKFDGATIHPQQGGSFMPTLQFPYTLENRGLTIDCSHDSSITGQLTGKGPLIKEGSAVLVMSGDNTGHTGGIEVRGGSLSLTNEVLKLASGTKFVGYTGAMLTIAYRDDGFVTRDCGIDLKVAGEGTFDLDIKAIGTPAEGSTYVLFKSGATADMLDRLSITPGYVLAVDGGKLVVTINATALRWVGNSPGDNRWTSVSNWDPSRVPGLSDRIIFERDDAFTTLYDLDSEVKLGSITVNRGAWTTDVGESAMTGPALAVEAGASFTMVNADGRKNMFSVAKNANYVAGLLDIGGAEQLISSDMSADQGLFRSGGEVRNGTYTINAVSWFRLNGVRDFTIGRNALVILPKQTSTVGQMNLHNANLRIDGGELRALNATSVSNSGGYIGNGGDATIEVVNGGVFAHTGKFGVLGYAVDGPGNGRILADNGTVNFGSRELFLGNTANSVGELRMTNSTLTCTSFTIGFSRELGEGEEIGPQIAEFVGSTLNIDHMTARRTNENTRVIFDGAMIYENGKQVELLPDIGVPYRLRGSGLTVRAYRTHERIELGGAFVGDGGIALESGGAKTTAALTGDDERRLDFTGALSVGKDVSLLATNKVFAGSLRVLSGGKANVRDSLFEGDVYVEDGATFEGVEERRYDEPLTLVTAVGKITIDPTLRERSDSFGNVYYVAVRRGRNVLCYGRDSGLVIRMR